MPTASSRHRGIAITLLRLASRVFPPEPHARMTAPEKTSSEMVKAPESMGRYLKECETTDIDVLDFGCGWGGETLWLSHHVRRAIGIDVDAGNIAQAQKALSDSRVENCEFVLSRDGTIPIDDCHVDAVFSTDTFEHVLDLDRAFSEIFRVLRPGGRLLTRFGPLFYSPLGYHLRWACQVPYAHLVFGLEPILTLRDDCVGAELGAHTWEDTGLNRKRFKDFRRHALNAGFELERFDPIPVKQLHWLTRIPVVSDFLTFGVDCKARKPE